MRRDAEQTGGGGKEAGGVHLFREPSKEKRRVTAEPARPKQQPRNRKHQAAEEAALDRKRTMAQAKGGH